ncbi:3-deoxy-7-phosphoheptulonate synthase [Patescibacteria group bacterium]|nr:3-deoxy-7-phosphoheptulonate synthase [Patescibacteria group bacterium]
MGIKVIKKIPSQEEIEKEMPLSKESQFRILKHRNEVRDILSGKDNRLLMIIGPCAAWPSDAVVDYAGRLAAIKDKLEKKIKIIMRVYTEKPRSTKGWNGPINQPDLCLPPDIPSGIRYARKLMIRIIEMNLPIASEALFIHDSMKFFPDFLSWMAIGARSTEDQEHRIYASAVDCPVGMKNPTSGSVEIGVNSVIAAQNSQVAIFHGYQIESSGNEYAHLVLRGGNQGPNFSLENILKTQELMEKNKLTNPAIVIDASHDNCRVDGTKIPSRQLSVVENVLDSVERHEGARNMVKGFMVESFIKAGSQKIDHEKPELVDKSGLSVVDPCIGWQETEDFLFNIYKKL